MGMRAASRRADAYGERMTIALITGGSRGIGRATAQELARRGVATIITYHRHPEDAVALVESIAAAGGRAAALPLDVSVVASFAAFRDAVREVLRGWGSQQFDALVNNAGYGLYAPFPTVTEADFDGLFAVHLKAPFFLTQTLLPLIADGGHIINVTSATTRVATAGVAPYASFKAGLDTLTRYLAKELGERRIRANSVSLGAIRTELGGGLTPAFEQLLAGQTALGRVGESEDVADVIAALIGNDLRWVNAQSIEVAGGYVI